MADFNLDDLDEAYKAQEAAEREELLRVLQLAWQAAIRANGRCYRWLKENTVVLGKLDSTTGEPLGELSLEELKELISRTQQSADRGNQVADYAEGKTPEATPAAPDDPAMDEDTDEDFDNEPNPAKGDPVPEGDLAIILGARRLIDRLKGRAQQRGPRTRATTEKKGGAE